MSQPFLIGDDAMALVVEDRDRRRALSETLLGLGSWVDVIVGQRDVSVRFDPLSEDPQAALARFAQDIAASKDHTPRVGEPLDIPICYAPQYGLDLPHLEAVLDLSAGEIIARHKAAVHEVEMIGFTPGFAYIAGAGEALNASRLGTPRAHLPAGSVGLSGGLTGVYALAGPGGWPIVGRTPLKLFQADRDPPFLLVPGMRVRFVEIDANTFAAQAQI